MGGVRPMRWRCKGYRWGASLCNNAAQGISGRMADGLRRRTNGACGADALRFLPRQPWSDTF